ncbi:MAG: hypothetical protein R2795_05390 [Saprospiraceae bacterium]
MQRHGKKGAIAGAVSIPLRHIHQTIEMAHIGDIEHCIDLLERCVSHLDQYNWDFANTSDDGYPVAANDSDWL